jgi:hypothetical protein
MATTSRIEETRDPDGITITTTTRQDFADFAPTSNVRSYRKTTEDGVITIIEEMLENVGSARYLVDSSVTQEPLETHSYFASMSDTLKTNWALWKKNPYDPALDPPGWKPNDSGDTQLQTLYYFWKRDITSFLSPRIVVKYTVVESHAPFVHFVGKIADHGLDLGTLPFSDMSFICTGANGQQQGEYWTNTYEYMGSGAGGWDTNIYS